MISLEQAVERILASVRPSEPEWAPLAESAGRVVASEVRARVDLPGFDNSAVDGYAVRAGDVFGVDEARPEKLRLAGRVEAGGPANEVEVGPHQCVRVFTGSAIPSGADAVVMQEATSVEAAQPQTVLVRDSVKPGEGIRRAGEDVRRGSVIAAGGTTLGAGHLCLLAANGINAVEVNRRPIVAILATGSELQEPGEMLRPECLYECNRPAVAQLTRGAGGLPRVYPIVRDSLADTTAALKKAFTECDLVVTCGGVSVGDLDFIKPAFESMGGAIDFWRVAIKPGKPFVCGRLGEKFLCGLPGNPVSAFVTFLLLVRPILRRWQGARDTGMTAVSGVLAQTLQNRDSRRHFMRVVFDQFGQVRLAGLQASHAMGSLAAANGLLDVPPNTTLDPGAAVRVLRWE